MAQERTDHAAANDSAERAREERREQPGHQLERSLSRAGLASLFQVLTDGFTVAACRLMKFTARRPAERGAGDGDQERQTAALGSEQPANDRAKRSARALRTADEAGDTGHLRRLRRHRAANVAVNESLLLWRRQLREGLEMQPQEIGLRCRRPRPEDRKSTRLNSSHVKIS